VASLFDFCQQDVKFNASQALSHLHEKIGKSGMPPAAPQLNIYCDTFAAEQLNSWIAKYSSVT